MYKRKSPPGSPNSVMATTLLAKESMADVYSKSSTPTPPQTPRRRRKQRRGTVEILAFVVLFSAFLLVGATTYVLLFLQPDDGVSIVSSLDEASLSYTCPSTSEIQPESAVNFDPIRFRNHYTLEDAHTRELQDFIANFRETAYDDWGRTYSQMKEGMAGWKRRAIVPYLQPGHKVYESAIGMGLNAFMTLEIIQQDKGPIPLEIYGNEYLVSSTQRANEFFDHVLPSHVHKGNVCVGDSTNISFVPSNTFDLVYTGYILPIGNPLHFQQPEKDPYSINHGRYHELCDGDTWRDGTLRDIAQRRQEDFYAAWVSEMIRIAKPGSPIVVEHVSQPKCDDREDWGGVSKSWWSVAIERYHWPIDPESIFMEDDHIYSFQRYHVFMRKSLVDNLA